MKLPVRLPDKIKVGIVATERIVKLIGPGKNGPTKYIPFELISQGRLAITPPENGRKLIITHPAIKGGEENPPKGTRIALTLYRKNGFIAVKAWAMLNNADAQGAIEERVNFIEAKRLKRKQAAA